MFYFIFWTGIFFLFSQSTSRQNQSRSGSSDQTARGDFDIGENGWLVALDDLFNPHTIAKQTVINTVGVCISSLSNVISILKIILGYWWFYFCEFDELLSGFGQQFR